MMKKGQVKRLDGRDSAAQAKFVESLVWSSRIALTRFTASLASNQSLQRNPPNGLATNFARPAALTPAIIQFAHPHHV